ncbi:MAG: peptide-N-glycosidase F-related protein [Dysgonomonas sp.]
MTKSISFLLFVITLFYSEAAVSQTSIKVIDNVLFYDGYNTLEKLAESIEPAPEGVVRLKTSLCTTRLSTEQLAHFGDSIVMNILVEAACDNYDRIGNVNLALVPKGQEIYNPDSVSRIELGRFITPFMNKNINPKTVPYTFRVDYLSHIFKDKYLLEQYDLWIELDIFGVPYAANTQVSGCGGRSDVFYGSVEFVTANTVDVSDNNVLIPLFMQANFNNYSADATTEIGKTIRSASFKVDKNLSDAQFVLITSNHGANSGGEEYNRRMHYVTFDNDTVLIYKPGRTSCEPFRKYNTQSNGIYGTSPKSDAAWQSFSNWCPGDVIDNRIIHLGELAAGDHNFTISVPEAIFNGAQGNFPLSLYLIGTTSGKISGIEVSSGRNVDYVQIYPNPVKASFEINSNKQVKQVSVFDLSGALSVRNQGSVIDVSKLSDGIYTARIVFIDGSVKTQKIIKL